MLLKVIFLVVMAAFAVVLLLQYGALMLLIDVLSSEKPRQIEKTEMKKPRRRAIRLTDRSRKWLDSKEKSAKEVD